MRGEIPNWALSCHSCSWHITPKSCAFRGSAPGNFLKFPFLHNEEIRNYSLEGGGMDWVGQQSLFLPWFVLAPWSTLKSWAGSWKGAEQTTRAIIALAPWLWFAIAAEQEEQFGWPWGRVLAALLRQGEDAPCSPLPLGAGLHPDTQRGLIFCSDIRTWGIKIP